MPGVIAGCLVIGRIGHWIQLLLAALGRDPARPAVVVRQVQRGPLFLATDGSSSTMARSSWHRLRRSSTFRCSNRPRMDMVFLWLLSWTPVPSCSDVFQNCTAASQASARICHAAILNRCARSNNRFERSRGIICVEPRRESMIGIRYVCLTSAPSRVAQPHC
jgi:hypothetical protein